MDRFIVTYLAVSLTIGLVMAFIEGGLWGSDPVEKGLVSAVIWPFILFVLVVAAPFWAAGKAGEWFEDWRTRTPQTASQVPGTDKAPSPNDQGEA